MSLSRRGFLVYVGLGTYSMLSGQCAWSQSSFPLPRRRGEPPRFFRPIRPSPDDRLILPEGYRHDLVCAWNDSLGSAGPNGKENFGCNNDLLIFFPIDALSGGRSKDEGLLWVNHENPNPLFVSGAIKGRKKMAEQIHTEKLSVGGSVLHVRRERGVWKHLPGSKWTRRFTALYPKIPLTGPVAATVPEGIGTLANCSGGKTPWNTVLSCEENYQEYNGVEGISGDEGFRWADAPELAIDERQYGWVVEIDPFGELPPLKHSALGRFSHENTALRIGPSGRLIIYMGDDARDQYLYKFVSADRHRSDASRAKQRKLLTAGMLYAADFTRGRWLPLDFARNQALRDAGFKDQADVLLRCRDAAKVIQATPIDRPEDCEVHRSDGTLYVALSNNDRHGNIHGHIVRLLEDNDDPEGEAFRFEVFLAGGPQSGLSCPDNLAFDKKGNLWVACDVSTKKLNQRPFDRFGNNGLFVVPTTGPSAGDAFQFASAPVQAELTGPWFTDNEDTLFLSVQHPGEESLTMDKLTSHWPEGGQAIPRPAVVAITGFPS